MESRLKQCYEITLPKSKSTVRHVYVNPPGIRLSSRATSEERNQLLREISTLLARDADYYVERIVPCREGCTVQFLNLSQRPPQYQQKLFGWTELEDNPKATITQSSLQPTVQSAASSAARAAVRQSDSAGAIAALQHKDRIKKAAEEKARLVEEAKIKVEMQALFEEAVKAAEVKAKQDAAAKVIADIAAGKKFFEFKPAEDKVKGAAQGYEEAKFADRLKELQVKKSKTTTTYLDTIPLEKEEKFSARIKKENIKKLAELKEREQAITEKLEQYPAKIASAQSEAESAFETAYNRYDQSIVSQQRKILLNAIDDYKKAPDWNPDAVRTLALSLRIDPRNIRFDHAAADFYNALQKKTREEMAELFFVMDQSLSSKVGGQEKYKDHPFIPLFKAAYAKEQKKLSEDAVKKDSTENLSSLRTVAEEKITGMHREIEQDLVAYQESLAEYDRFLAKERDDFIAIQELLATAEEAVTSDAKPMAEFSRLTKSIEDMQQKARILQEEIAAKEQEFKLHASDKSEMATFAQLTQSALVTIQEEKLSFINEQKQLPVKLGQPDISLEQANQAVADTQDKLAISLQKSRQQEITAEDALKKIQLRHDRVSAEAEAEDKRIRMREKLYNTLETMLVDQVDYWKKQQSIIGGVNVLENNGKKTNVPTGIGEMIRAIDERRKPLVDDEKKSTSSISRFFKNNTKPIPPLEERKLSPEVVMQRLRELKEIASKRLVAKDFLGRTQKHAGRTDATKDFYKKLIAISDADLADVKQLETHIKAFDESLAKQAQKEMSHRHRK